MARAPDPIHCTAALQRPASPKNASWWFVVLPKAASAQLPTRGMCTVEGTLGNAPFHATLAPDGDGGHWFKLDRALHDASGAKRGERVELIFAPVSEEPEPEIPRDVRASLAGHSAAQAQWATLTPVQRRDWIHWITSGKKAKTRDKRLATACDMLGSGKRRACCFDRSGMYSKGNMGPPDAAPD